MHLATSRLLHGITTGELHFSDVIAHIEHHYHYTPIRFSNGDVVNEAGTNEGSAKVFSFAKLNGLSQLDTLTLFGEHYQSVLATPDGSDHANIRSFMFYGWQGVGMPTNALTAKA